LVGKKVENEAHVEATPASETLDLSTTFRSQRIVAFRLLFSIVNFVIVVVLVV